jgi:hypothetical protein
MTSEWDGLEEIVVNGRRFKFYDGSRYLAMLKVHMDEPSFVCMAVRGAGDRFYVFCDRGDVDVEYAWLKVDASEKVELSMIKLITLRNVDEELEYCTEDLLAVFFFNTGYGTIVVYFERDGSRVRICNPYSTVKCVIVRPS